jgi:hypothetical protein
VHFVSTDPPLLHGVTDDLGKFDTSPCHPDIFLALKWSNHAGSTKSEDILRNPASLLPPPSTSSQVRLFGVGGAMANDCL